ncbi:hypothetical protein ROZALSC1DRAFT_26704, partial [Rozella allomycis CSF55]
MLQLVDVLSFSNKSLFIFDEPFHGFYIHGKTVHESGEMTIDKMVDYLNEENAVVLSNHGLDNSDVQKLNCSLVNELSKNSPHQKIYECYRLLNRFLCHFINK